MSTTDVALNVEGIAAPMMLGALWNWTLYGVLVVQLYVYSYNFPGDRTLLKLLVYSIFLVETVQTALSGADLYYWFVSGFGDMEHLASPYMSAFDVPIIGSIVSLIVQLFFVYRIWVLSGRSKRTLYLCLVICLCSAVGAVAAIYGGIYTHIHRRFLDDQMLKILTLTWLSGNAASDSLIAGSMLFHLARRHREGYFSEHALTRIVRLTVETNVLTTTVGFVALLMVAVYTDKNWFTCPIAVLGKLYSNTLLVSLNNRISIREEHGAGVVSTVVTFPVTPDLRPTSEIADVESKKPSAALVARSSEDGTGQDTPGVFEIA